MTRRLWACGDRALTWWLLHGQFSPPIRLISPGRRAAHREVAAWCAVPGFADDQRSQLRRRIWRETNGVDDQSLGLREAELFRRIFGGDGSTRERT
ncbi:hypothetical protein ABZW30_04425 [Kitasatospora sp. NPDC004669]|uniref:hypothetical protein n=1 Tax=Kitasatospora sp. NPDC004669 TaxID=3154555 RepID=UPI0033AB39A5